jgi:hypothetical protein
MTSIGRVYLLYVSQRHTVGYGWADRHDYVTRRHTKTSKITMDRQAVRVGGVGMNGFCGGLFHGAPHARPFSSQSPNGLIALDMNSPAISANVEPFCFLISSPRGRSHGRTGGGVAALSTPTAHPGT